MDASINAGKRSLITAFLLEGALTLFLNVTIYGDLPTENQHVVLWSTVWGIIVLLCGVLFIKSDRFYNWLNTGFQLPEYQDKIKIIQDNYPGGSLTTEKARNGDVLYWMYEYARK